MKEPIKKPAFKLDIFKVLSQLDARDLHIWEKLSEDEQKGFSSFIITRWMSGTADALQLMYVNELVNSLLFKLGKDHEELYCKLLACCGSQRSRRFQWIAEAKKNKTSNLALTVIKDYYEYSTREALDTLDLLSSTDIYELAEDLGWQQDELKKLKKEIGA
jgi:hypothetical protein